MLLKTRHTGLVVTNISASIVFYKQLGLEIWKHENEVGDFISCVVGLKDAEIETAKLKLPDGSLLELLEYKSHPTQSIGSAYASNKHGCSHVAFTVENIDEVASKVVELGGSIVNSPMVSVSGSVKVMYCHDLDGILIEMVEEL